MLSSTPASVRAVVLLASACAASALFSGACASPVKPAVIPPPAPASTPAKAEVCDDTEPYIPRAASTAPQPNLPVVPEIPNIAIKLGADYTVIGAVRRLSSGRHTEDFSGEVTIVGVIVASNLSTVPACALHRAGQRDPEHCVTEIPSFTIADDPQATARIRVLGWASNFAAVFEALTLAKNAESPVPYRDDRWGVEVPVPLPATGARVRVRGRYGFMFTKSSTGVVADPDNGVFTVASVDTLVPATTPAKLGR